MTLRYKRTGKNRGIFGDDSGVSPVIAVILMVAITVVMAAIVSSWSSGVKAPTSPTTVGLDVQRTNNIINVTITAIDPASAAPLANITYRHWDNSSSTFITDFNQSVDVGFTRTIDTGSSIPQQFVVTATFKDSSKRVLYSQTT